MDRLARLWLLVGTVGLLALAGCGAEDEPAGGDEPEVEVITGKVLSLDPAQYREGTG